MRRLAPALAPLCLLAACGSSSGPVFDAGGGVSPGPSASGTPVRFIAFGDAGKGTANQMTVGAAMAAFCKLKECQFALEFGDNIYESGLTSVTDPQWQTKFETPYKDLNLPIYPTLGNHDNSASPQGGEGSNNAKGDVQVAYTTAAENVTKKWTLPARYHRFTYPKNLAAGEAPVIEFFCLDSNPMASTIPDLTNTQYNYITYANTQLQWFQSALQSSTAKWTVAYAHHPYISNGQHGNAGSFDGGNPNLPGTTSGKPWLDFLNASLCDTRYRGGVDLFMHGHDHDFEWLKPVGTCNAKTEFVLNGSAADPRAFGNATRNPTYFQKDNALSFAWYEVTGTTLRGEVYVLDDAGKLKLDAAGQPAPDFTRTLTKP